MDMSFIENDIKRFLWTDICIFIAEIKSVDNKKAEPNDPAFNSGYCWLIIPYISV